VWVSFSNACCLHYVCMLVYFQFFLVKWLKLMCFHDYVYECLLFGFHLYDFIFTMNVHEMIDSVKCVFYSTIFGVCIMFVCLCIDQNLMCNVLSVCISNIFSMIQNLMCIHDFVRMFIFFLFTINVYDKLICMLFILCLYVCVFKFFVFHIIKI
jgi:hypothetical protein